MSRYAASPGPGEVQVFDSWEECALQARKWLDSGRPVSIAAIRRTGEVADDVPHMRDKPGSC
jgi:hypothetical protein